MLLIVQSSIINNVKNACKQNNNTSIEKPAKVRSIESETLTLHYEKTILTSCASIFDTMGWTPFANYTSSEFDAMLDGKLAHGTLLKGSVAVQSQTHDPIDVVVFVMDQSSMSNVQSEVLGFSPFIKKAVEKKKMVLFAVTKVDKLSCFASTKLRSDSDAPNTIATNEQFATIRDQLYAQLKPLLPNDKEPAIFPILNYLHSENRRLAQIEATVKDMFNYIVDNFSVAPAAAKTSFNLYAGEEIIQF